MKLSCAYKIQKRWYDRASDEVLKLKNFYFYWLYIKLSEQKKNHTIENIDNIKILETLSSTIERSAALKNILRVQKLII